MVPTHTSLEEKHGLRPFTCAQGTFKIGPIEPTVEVQCSFFLCSTGMQIYLVDKLEDPIKDYLITVIQIQVRDMQILGGGSF